MTFAPPVPLLAATPQVRPVFLIVMGAFLLLTAWRMTRGTRGWTPRLLLTGASLLAIGYSILTPLYEAGMLVRLDELRKIDADPATIVFWHCARLLAMNAGWFIFGLGIAAHAGLFETARSFAPVQVPRTSHSPRTSPVHDSIA